MKAADNCHQDIDGADEQYLGYGNVRCTNDFLAAEGKSHLPQVIDDLDYRLLRLNAKQMLANRHRIKSVMRDTFSKWIFLLPFPAGMEK